jgi:DNA-binding NarL/FixJ family response regulator
MKKVVIVEKVKNIRDGIKILIHRFSKLDCQETFSDLTSLKQNLNKVNPDILLLQLELKDCSIVEEIGILRSLKPELIIVLLTLNEENELIFDAMLNGASAYVHKNAPASKLVKVLEDASEKKIMINSLIARKIEKYIKENRINGYMDGNDLKLLQKVTEGYNLLAIENSLKINSEQIKEIFWKITEQLFLRNIKNFEKLNKQPT